MNKHTQQIEISTCRGCVLADVDLVHGFYKCTLLSDGENRIPDRGILGNCPLKTMNVLLKLKEDVSN